jgi:hypothetical protein
VLKSQPRCLVSQLMFLVVLCNPARPVQLSLYRPLGFQQVEARIISRQLAHEGGKVVSPWYSFLLDAESTPEP